MTRRPCMLLAFVGALACDDDEPERGRAVASASAVRPESGPCARGGGRPGDPKTAAFFPRVVGDYCVDPNTETRAYGENAGASLADACREQFTGECDLYEAHGLRRVVTLRYVDGRGSPGAIAVTLSRFGSRQASFAFFTDRVLAGEDPASVAARSLDAGGAGALRDRSGYVWRGEHVAELTYTNELLAPERLRATSGAELAPVAKAVGAKLTGPPVLPDAVQLLPSEHRIELGIGYAHRDVLGVSGVGSGAIGYYADAPRRWRVFVVIRPDEAAAEDVVDTLKRLDGARSMKDMPFGVLRVPRQSSESAARVEWLITQRGARVYGVGDEEGALEGLSPDERRRVSLDDAAKVAVLRKLRQAGR